ncbi:hypothetical protein BASA83_000487 [Batrachochytrium salamandrivorans]|nr:hypothetical protein BASA83_000487 [Batrachochytrium salamandrivorans]
MSYDSTHIPIVRRVSQKDSSKIVPTTLSELDSLSMLPGLSAQNLNVKTISSLSSPPSTSNTRDKSKLVKQETPPTVVNVPTGFRMVLLPERFVNDLKGTPFAVREISKANCIIEPPTPSSTPDASVSTHVPQHTSICTLPNAKSIKADATLKSPPVNKGKRPMNSFFQYRSDKLALIKEKHGSISNPEIATIAAKMWREEPESVRLSYKQQSLRVYQEHFDLNPDFVWMPKYRGRKNTVARTVSQMRNHTRRRDTGDVSKKHIEKRQCKSPQLSLGKSNVLSKPSLHHGGLQRQLSGHFKLDKPAAVATIGKTRIESSVQRSMSAPISPRQSTSPPMSPTTFQRALAQLYSPSVTQVPNATVNSVSADLTNSGVFPNLTTDGHYSGGMDAIRNTLDTSSWTGGSSSLDGNPRFPDFGLLDNLYHLHTSSSASTSATSTPFNTPPRTPYFGSTTSTPFIDSDYFDLSYGEQHLGLSAIPSSLAHPLPFFDLDSKLEESASDYDSTLALLDDHTHRKGVDTQSENESQLKFDVDPFRSCFSDDKSHSIRHVEAGEASVDVVKPIAHHLSTRELPHSFLHSLAGEFQSDKDLSDDILAMIAFPESPLRQSDPDMMLISPAPATKLKFQWPHSAKDPEKAQYTAESAKFKTPKVNPILTLRNTNQGTQLLAPINTKPSVALANSHIQSHSDVMTMLCGAFLTCNLP